MYLKNLKIWNFRKIGTSNGQSEINSDNPGVNLCFNPSLNVLVGENNSGKTSIVDAIRFVLGTHSYDYHRLDENDFHHNGTTRHKELKIECLLSGLSNKEAGHFMEWAHFDENKKYELKVWLTAYITDYRVISNIRAGNDENGAIIEGGVKDLLRITYLKPLRDAEAELSAGYKSRLAQILRSDPLFRGQLDDEKNKIDHPLEKYLGKANELIKNYFSDDILAANAEYDIEADTPGGGAIKKKVQDRINEFFHSDDKQSPEFNISGSELNSILRKLSLTLEDHKSGLGALNQLFIAIELLLLQDKDHHGLRLALIEELEAHLHPQAQLRIIDALQNTQSELQNQFILTSHSTTLASKILLQNLVICLDGQAFSLAPGQTGLEKDDYEFLERFLDSTKANLFFAKGVILVEGATENTLVPAIAEIVDRPLHKFGVSVVNVGSKALLRYAKIFQRLPEGTLPVKVAVITDLDIEQVNPATGVIQSKKRKTTGTIPEKDKEIEKLETEYHCTDGRIKVFHSPLWTLEYDLALGGLTSHINRSTYIAQLAKSRSSHQNFKGISSAEVGERIKKADKFLEDWQTEGLLKSQIAFNIYSRLKNNRASKAVTAQWLAKIMLSEKEGSKEVLTNDQNAKYILNAIYHVTRPKDENN